MDIIRANAPLAVLIISIIFMFVLVYNSFTNQRLQFGGAEVSASFLTNRSNFRWGLIVYLLVVGDAFVFSGHLLLGPPERHRIPASSRHTIAESHRKRK